MCNQVTQLEFHHLSFSTPTGLLQVLMNGRSGLGAQRCKKQGVWVTEEAKREREKKRKKKLRFDSTPFF
jgi:hypothetical protein